MATARARRVIEIDVTTSRGLQSGIRQVNRQLRSIEGNAARTAREMRHMGNSFNFLALTAKAFIALRVARFFTDMSDTMVLLGARINIVTEETVGLDAAFNDLYDVANDTRQSIEATGTLYARLGFSTKALGLEHQDLLDIVQGVNNTLLLSGSSAQESASSIIQLSQAFSKGALDGDEFRSVSEGNVVLFGAMQDVLGKTAGELRQFSRDGKLTAELLAKVLTSEQVRALQERVDDIPLTFGQAFTKLRNSFAELAQDLEPIFVTVAGWFSQLAEGFSADLTIGEGYREGILSLGDVMLEGSGTLEQRKQLAEEVNVELARRNQLAEFYRRDVKLGIDDEREALKNAERQKEILFKRIEGTNNIIDNWKKFSEIVVTGAEEERRSYLQQVKAQNQIIDNNRTIIDQALAEDRRKKELLRIDIERAKSQERLSDEFERIRKSVRTPAEILGETLDKLEKMRALGFDVEVLDNAATKAMYEYGEAMDKVNDSMTETEKNAKELGVALGQTLANGVGDIGDALYDYMLGIETSFKATINNILEDIGRLIVKITLLNALKSGLSGTSAGAFLFPTENANGNAFSQGSVIPFATGGVIDSPAFFPMTSGTGLMGEAGPEAILPLKRGADGKLGVTAESGSSAKSVSVNIENKGNGDSRIVESTATTDINGTVVNIVLDDLHRGGPLSDAIRSRR